MSQLNQFADWYSSAKRGDEYTYFSGHLAATRGFVYDEHGYLTKEAAKNELNILCQRLWEMAMDGRVSLLQRRIGEPRLTGDMKRIDPTYRGAFEYLVQKVR